MVFCDWCEAPDVPAFVMWDGNHACAEHRQIWYTFGTEQSALIA